MNAPSLCRSHFFLHRFKEQLFNIPFVIALLGLVFITSQTAFAAIYTVTNTSDSGSGSLRDAISQVNSGTGGGDTINFSGVTGIITLGSTLAITEPVTINGPGANLLSISGNDAVRVFSVATTAANTVINGLTITHGNATVSPNYNGAGILASASLTVNNCTFSYNTTNNGPINAGAAILDSAGTLTVNSSTFYNNQALIGDGGAIDALTLVVNDSTFYNNSAQSEGGAIWISLGSKLSLSNNTIVGNRVTNTTGTSAGGGVFITGLAPAILLNNIISGNTAVNAADYYCVVACGTVPAGNLMGNASITSLLTPLQYNGGPTMTMAPRPGLTGVIKDGLNSTLAFDQRGIARPTSGASDIGAVQSYNLVVSTTADSTNPSALCDGSNGDICSLRDALNLANSQGAGDVVTVGGLTGTINLLSPLPVDTADLNINGPGANQLTISGASAGAGSSSIFNITNANAVTNISGVTLTGGQGIATGGGAINNQGATLTLNNCELNNNTATAHAGGALNNGANSTASVIDCTFSENGADSGGAINNDGLLTVENSTFNGNTATTYEGGAIYNQGTANVETSTILGNNAEYTGGGIFNAGTIVVTNSIVAGNLELQSPGDDCSSCGTQNAFNLISTTAAPITAAQVMLAPLGYYGPNQTVETMLPYPGSPAIQAGDPAQLTADLTTDERQLPRTINSKLDLGAVESNYTAVQFVQQPSNTTVNANIAPAVTLSVTESGTTVANIPVSVTFTGTGVLSGTLTQSTVAPTTLGDPAVASFGDLKGDTPGTGDTLTATLTVTPAGITPAQTLSVTSDPFDILGLTPTTVSFSPAAPTSVVYGSAPITLNGTATASGTPTGQAVTYQLTSGPGSISGNTVSFTGVGTVVVTASTTANGSYAATNTQVSILVTPAPLTITVGNASRGVGAADPTFTSTASGLVNGDTIGGDLTVTYSTTATAASPAGAYSIAAALSGVAAANYTPTIVNGTLTISALTSIPVETISATGTSSSGPSTTPDQVVSVTVPTIGGVVPTGTITIYDNGTPVGTGTLGPNGTVVVTIPGASIPAGSSTITAGYSGDAHYGSSTSAPQTVSVTSPSVLDFTLTLTSAQSQTVIPGAAAPYTVQVAPTSGTYPGVVSFTATGLPTDAIATFTPATVAANGGPTAINVSVQTAPLVSANNLGRNVAPIALGVLLLPLAGVKRRRLLRGGGAAGRYLFMAVLLLVGAAGMAGLTGCGSHNGFFGHAPQTYNITITATSGTVQHSVNATLNVQ